MGTLWRDDLLPEKPWAPSAVMRGMVFRIEHWLAEDITVDGVTMRRCDRLAYLLTANAGREVRGWGFIRRRADGHQLGLTQDEAIELCQAMAFVDGLEAAGVRTSAAIRECMERYQERWQSMPLQARRGLTSILLALGICLGAMEDACECLQLQLSPPAAAVEIEDDGDRA